MNKFTSVLMLSCALALSACGGDSDSSGSSASNYLEEFPACPTNGNNITVKEMSAGCRVKKPDLNNGKTFVLRCSVFQIPGGPKRQEFSYTGTSDGDKKSIENNTTYTYTCDTGVFNGY